MDCTSVNNKCFSFSSQPNQIFLSPHAELQKIFEEMSSLSLTYTVGNQANFSPIAEQASLIQEEPEESALKRLSMAKSHSTVVSEEVSETSSRQITIDYFDSAVRRNISCSEHLCVQQIIEKALQIYVKDVSLQFHKPSLALQEYELLPLAPSPSPLSGTKTLAECNIYAFSLRVKPPSDLKAKRKLYVMSCEGEVVDQVAAEPSETLQRVLVGRCWLRRGDYELVESPESQFPLSWDFELKDLSSSIVYIRQKVFSDRPSNSDSLMGAIRRQTTLLSLAKAADQEEREANSYEQFRVTKVNSFGIKQERVLGIDASKIYNYEPKAHQAMTQERTGGAGTKRPQRLTRDIRDVKATAKGVDIVFVEKTLNYVVKDIEARNRIVWKLRAITRRQ